MRILQVASEIYPLVKTGGLADAVAALPAALAARGHDVRLLLPGLPGIVDGLDELKPVVRIGPAFGAAVITLQLGRMPDSGLPAYVIDAPYLYRREGNPYVGPDGHDWSDNHRRFALLGWIAAHLAGRELDADWTPDVIHAHDWPAGLAPAYIADNPGLTTPSVFTIHNLAFRGLFPLDTHLELSLPPRLLTPQGLEFHHQISFMKAGLVYADRLTTVSPTYAREICTGEFGCELEGVLRQRGPALSGILNGVDPAIWNPARDPALAQGYDLKTIAGKAECKRALQAELGLVENAAAPLFGIVSRLTTQKGVDLILGALPELLAAGGQLAVLGSGDPTIEARCRDAARAHPGMVATRIAYSEPLSHRMIAGSDVLLVPSRFEPCGLTQLYALRYGTLPLVRRVGGLADTVVDATPATVKAGAATGFVFDEANSGALGRRIREACAAHRDARLWRKLQKTAMTQDFSWDNAAAQYETLYAGLHG